MIGGLTEEDNRIRCTDSTDGKSASRKKYLFIQKLQFGCFLREALFPSVLHIKFCCPDFVRSFVLEIIDFYEGEQKAVSRLLSTGVLHDRFLSIQK